MKIKIFLVILLSFPSSLAWAQTTGSWYIDGLEVQGDRSFVSLLPGAECNIEFKNSYKKSIVVHASEGKLTAVTANIWKFTASDKSETYELFFRNLEQKVVFTLVVFVMVPTTEVNNGYLNSYRIGHYPSKPLANRSNYENPTGFIEVTQSNQDTYISPNFQLKQFLCKQNSGWPKYVVLKTELLVKLELLLEMFRKTEPELETLYIMSGYRTPFYNKAIGNVPYSRHVFGDAADVYIDQNMDQVIDDLNKDGKHTMADAMVIHKMADTIDNNPDHEHLVGGIGKYKKNAAHTYYIHVDTRGYKARW